MNYIYPVLWSLMVLLVVVAAAVAFNNRVMEPSLHVQWMRGCTQTVILRGYDPDTAFNFCRDRKAWLDSHEATGWR